MELLAHLLKIFPLIVLRYFFFAGIAYLIFYVWKKQKFTFHKIQPKYPDRKVMNREVMYSLVSLGIFALIGTGVYWAKISGYTKIYTDIHAHSAGYFIFSVVAFILLHDFYFYWVHRLMHWDRIYKYVHRIHHLSTNPTPWAAFSFHPIEAVLEVAILPIMVFIMPLHPLAIFIWVIFQTVLNVMGHLGFELFPSGFTKHTLYKWQNTSVHHNMHHRYVRCNYGLYFNLWDRIMGTNHAQYDAEFEKVKARTAAAHQPEPVKEEINEVPEVVVS